MSFHVLIDSYTEEIIKRNTLKSKTDILVLLGIIGIYWKLQNAVQKSRLLFHAKAWYELICYVILNVKLVAICCCKSQYFTLLMMLVNIAPVWENICVLMFLSPFAAFFRVLEVTYCTGITFDVVCKHTYQNITTYTIGDHYLYSLLDRKLFMSTNPWIVGGYFVSRPK